ncbi:hypothetical protein MSG28_010565 [Choristoneura fumiferana]|uniref:Uncharacterized protein n=1 Tax=Choristoneura fumiferana TaxID=7141 RepID=A0ACC0KMY0_CHOFU|nr:hypothetical protein MSG28_010565 [Choristoneura fumiferana]
MKSAKLVAAAGRCAAPAGRLCPLYSGSRQRPSAGHGQPWTLDCDPNIGPVNANNTLASVASV